MHSIGRGEECGVSDGAWRYVRGGDRCVGRQRGVRGRRLRGGRKAVLGHDRPASAAAGAATSFLYTVKNLDVQQPSGAFRVQIPAGGWAVSGCIRHRHILALGQDLVGNAEHVCGGDTSKRRQGATTLACEGSVSGRHVHGHCAVQRRRLRLPVRRHQANQFQGPTTSPSKRTATPIEWSRSQEVVAGAIASVSIDPVGTPKTAGEPFDVTVRTFNGCGKPDDQEPHRQRSQASTYSSTDHKSMTSRP